MFNNVMLQINTTTYNMGRNILICYIVVNKYFPMCYNKSRGTRQTQTFIGLHRKLTFCFDTYYIIPTGNAALDLDERFFPLPFLPPDSPPPLAPPSASK